MGYGLSAFLFFRFLFAGIWKCGIELGFGHDRDLEGHHSLGFASFASFALWNDFDVQEGSRRVSAVVVCMIQRTKSNTSLNQIFVRGCCNDVKHDE